MEITLNVDVFDSELGWMAILGKDRRLSRIMFGYPTERALWQALDGAELARERPRAWHPKLARQLQMLARGVPQMFGQIELDIDSYSDFARAVMSECRRIGWGRTRTYGELAAACGAPGAARAVGNVMATNRFPLVVPCHRVVAADGRLGGFSAPQGLAMKRRLLDLEGGTSSRRQRNRSSLHVVV